MSDMHGEDQQNQDKPQPASGSPSAPPPSSKGNGLRNPIILVIIAIIIIAAIIGAYFLGSHHRSGATPAAALGDGQTRTAAELSARGLCEAALDRVKAYGVVEADATLADKDGDKTAISNRLVCNAKSALTTYRIAVDQRCTDMGQEKCIEIWNVVDGTGKGLYQHREFLPPEE